MASTLNLARELLADELPRRWMHVQGVAHQATRFHGVVPHDRLELLIASAYVHDIGYAAPIRQTGFHPLDGARHLRRCGFDEALVCLVANHTCASIEAELRHLRPTLEQEFPLDPTLPHDELTFCDLTTGPAGETVSVDDRLADIRRRYGPDDIVSRFIDRAEAQLRAAVGRAELTLHGTHV
ncbi:MAG: HD domain-containing protein [Acidimicrobiales bacterium]